MSNLYKLGLRDLPLDEAILIKAIFRLSSEQLGHAWQVVDDGPVDAWIADSVAWEADLARLARGQKNAPTLYLSRLHNASMTPVLTRPIRAHALVQWLSDTAAQLPAKTPAALPASVAVPVPAAVPAAAYAIHVVESVIPDHDPWAVTEPAALPFAEIASKPVLTNQALLSEVTATRGVAAEPIVFASLTVPVAPVFSAEPESATESAAADGAATQQLDPDSRYLLRRWPPAQIMGNDPKRLRITSLLSKQALQVDELSNLSGASVEECEGWMSTLLHSELLDTRAGAVQGVMASKAFSAGAGLSASPDQTPGPAMAMAPKRTMSLVSAIRRRLGI